MPRMSAEARIRLEEFKAVKVRHARLLETHEQVTQAVEEHAGSAYLWMYGPGGVGKSTVVHQVKEQFRDEEPNRAIEPVVLVEARSSDIGAYVRLDYYRQVLQALKGHAIVDEMLANIAAKTKASRISRHLTEWLDMREYVEAALSHCLVKAVMIDEAQHLMQGHRPLEQLDWLKSMSNKTNVLHVLAGTYDLVDFSVLDGQMARRGRDLHFPRYQVEKETERGEFIGALKYLLERLPLECDVKSWLSYWRWFAEGSVGCVGVLKDWLVETVRTIYAEQDTTLSMEALRRAAPGPSNRVRMESDARAGEHKVEMEQAESRRLMQILFGKASLDQISEPLTRGDLAPSANTNAPQKSPLEPKTALPTVPKGESRRVGERAPLRDPVGEMLAASPSNKCAFKGIIDLSREEMKEMGIIRVECPECRTTRSLDSEGAQIRFPPHDKRKTRRPSHEERWVLQGTMWKLAKLPI